MNQTTKNLITLTILIVAAWYVATHRGEFSSLESLAAGDIAAITAALLVFFVATGVTFSLLVKLVGIRLSSL